MFTGIVETMGVIKQVNKIKSGYQLTILPKKKLTRVKLGESIAVNGICLTVSKIKGQELRFDVIAQTLRMTNLKNIKANTKVNLERALKFGDRLGGHYVLGHIEAIGKIRQIISNKKEVEVRIDYPSKLNKFLVDKGCIAINGISLTIGKLTKTYFSVFLIPHSLKITTLGQAQKGDQMNLETDILLKRKTSKLTNFKLK